MEWVEKIYVMPGAEGAGKGDGKVEACCAQEISVYECREGQREEKGCTGKENGTEWSKEGVHTRGCSRDGMILYSGKNCLWWS